MLADFVRLIPLWDLLTSKPRTPLSDFQLKFVACRPKCYAARLIRFRPITGLLAAFYSSSSA